MSRSEPPILIVANPIAGSGRARAAAEQLTLALRAAGRTVELCFTSARGDGQATVARSPAGLFVAVGGDGTVREIFEGLGERVAPVAVLPMGTANVMGLDLGLSRDPAESARMILAGRTTALDVARTSAGQLSFLVTGIGIDAQVVRALERLRRGPITKRTWARAAASAVFSDPTPRLEVALDGRALPGEYCQVLFANVVHYGGFRALARDRVLDDGLWEAYLFPSRSKLGSLFYGLRALTRGFPGGGVERVRARRLEVRSAAPVPVQVDGDLAGSTPLAIELERIQRRLVIP